MRQQTSDDRLCQSTNVQSFFDSELDVAMRPAMRAHIAECNVCAAELRGLQQLQSLMEMAFGFTSDLTLALQRHALVSH